MNQSIQTKSKTIIIDIFFWVVLSTMIGVALSLPAGRSQTIIWVMLAVGILVRLHFIVLAVKMLVDKLSGSVKTATVAYLGASPYMIRLGPVRTTNQEKPIYYTLFTKDPVVPYLLRMTFDNKRTKVMVLALSRKQYLKLQIKPGQAIEIDYLERSRVITGFRVIS